MDQHVPKGVYQRNTDAIRQGAADAKRAFTQPTDSRYYDVQGAIDMGDGTYLAEAYFPPAKPREQADHYQIIGDWAYCAYLKAGEHTADGQFTIEDAQETINMLSTYLTGNRFTPDGTSEF